MRTITSVCFGFAIALSAFALTSAPASALEAPAAAPIVNSGVTKVQEGYREEREHAEHCGCRPAPASLQRLMAAQARLQ